MSDDNGYIPAGQEWMGCLCVNERCGLPILVVQVTPEMKNAQGDVVFRGERLELTCRHCETTAVYEIEQYQLFETLEKDKLS
jgi:hypothetical protein